MTRFLTFLAALLLVSEASAEDLSLPTPLEHYQNYDWQADANKLFLELAAAAPEATRTRAMELFQNASGEGERPKVSQEEIQELLDSIDWKRYRTRIEHVLLHGSRVLDILPKEAEPFLPLIHDGLLFFLDRVSDERFIERLVAQANLPKDATRGQRVVAFIVNTPSLQKLAQIVARNPALDPDVREALQILENGISSARYEQVMQVVKDELPASTISELGIEFDEHLLAEASVGAVVVAHYHPNGDGATQRAACKILKPQAVANLEADLNIIDGILRYFEQYADFYDIGNTPLVDIFEEIREALAKEVQVADERQNLIRARDYYKDTPEIEVPAVLPFSTPNVTCMEFVQGVKITDAFPGHPKERAELARRLSDALTFDVLFSKKDPALFHGDPHAGNVFHVEDGGRDPYRIALLDWGLAAQFTREERAEMVQLMVGLYLRDAKRLGNNVGVLLDFRPSNESDREEMRRTVAEIVGNTQERDMFPLLNELITELAKTGYRVRYEAAIFIKSQVTILGIMKELDPEFDQDDYVMGRIGGQVFRELHTRLLRTVWFPDWNSHGYRSLLSNEDVKDIQMQRTGRFFKKVGKGIWTAVSFQWLF